MKRLQIKGKVHYINKLDDDNNYSKQIDITHSVLNEVVISRISGSVITLNIAVNGKELCNVSADGVILASSNGSTA